MGLTFPSAHVLMLLAFVPGAMTAQSPRPPAQQLARPLQPALIEPPTRIEALLATPGIVVAADYYPIDMRFGPGLAMDAVVVTDVDSQTRLRGLRVQVSEDGRPNGRTEASFLDFDEVTRLSRALGTMSTLISRYSQDSQRATDLSFSTAGGFHLAIHETGRNVRVLVSTGLVEPIGIQVVMVN